jgi:ATP-dependent Lhr-like helicase
MPDDELDQTLRDVFGFERHRPEGPLSRAQRTFLTDHGHHPYPFQQQAFEGIGMGRNTLLVAGTAQGKTEAAVVPIAARILDAGRQFACCYLAPTRALLNDLYGRLEAPLAALNLRAVVRHGDRPTDPRDPNIDLLLTTPESLDSLLGQRAAVLRRVRIVVVDEVHQLYGTPRGAHVVSLLERLKYAIDPDKRELLQRIALSATVGSPASVSAWLRGSDGPVDVICAPANRNIDAQLRWCGTDHDAARWVAESGYRKTLLFANSRARCEELAAHLADLSTVPVLVHYSDLGSAEREYVEANFRRAEEAICVATSTLELGIDIGSIDAVVLADPPFTVQSFLQRLGRAARRETTVPVLMVAGSEAAMAHHLGLLSLAERGAIEDEPYPEWFSVLAQQVLSLVAANSRARIYERVPTEVFGCWPWFGNAEARQLLDGLAVSEFLLREEQIQSYRQGRNLTLALGGMGVSSNIGGVAGGRGLYRGQRRIGSVELSGISEGDVLRYAGRYWRVMGITPAGATVEPSEPVQGARMPRWSGRWLGGLSLLVAREIQALLANTRSVSACLQGDASARWDGLRGRAVGLSDAPDIVWECNQGRRRTSYTFGGDLENSVLCLLLGQHGMVARRSPGHTLSGVSLTSAGYLGFAGCTEADLRAIQGDHWRALRHWTQAGAFFDHMPMALRRREVLAQLWHPDLVARVTRPRQVVALRHPLFP